MKRCSFLVCAFASFALLVAPALGGVVFSDAFDGDGYDAAAWDDVAAHLSQLQWDCPSGSTVSTAVAGGMAAFSGDGGDPWDYGRALVSDAAFSAPSGTAYYVFTAELAALDGTLGAGHQFLAGIGVLDAAEANGWSVVGSVVHPYADDDGFIAELNYRDAAGRHMGNGGAPAVNATGILTMVVEADAVTVAFDGTPVYRYAPLPSGRYDAFRIAIYGAARISGDSIHAGFDAVSLAYVPEPATAGLLLLGWAATAWRKRG